MLGDQEKRSDSSPLWLILPVAALLLAAGLGFVAILAYHAWVQRGDDQRSRQANSANRSEISSGTNRPPRPDPTASPNTQPGGGPTTANTDDLPPPPPKPDSVKPGAVVSGGVLNGKAVNLPKPAYPPVARAAHASGTVSVQVTVDETGHVISAVAVSGHPLLRAAATDAARNARFSPTLLSGVPVKVTGTLIYNFTAE